MEKSDLEHQQLVTPGNTGSPPGNNWSQQQQPRIGGVAANGTTNLEEGQGTEDPPMDVVNIESAGQNLTAQEPNSTFEDQNPTSEDQSPREDPTAEDESPGLQDSSSSEDEPLISSEEEDEAADDTPPAAPIRRPAPPKEEDEPEVIQLSSGMLFSAVARFHSFNMSYHLGQHLPIQMRT